jgi:hypothetical protein
VAPFLAGVAPGNLPKGGLAPIAIALTGERFAQGAVLRTVGVNGTVVVATQFVDAQHLKAQLDLGTEPAGTLDLRIVNPDRVISNDVPVQVTVPTPAIDAISPAVATAGVDTTVVVTGAGLVQSSACWVQAPGATDGHAVSTTLASDGVHCELGTLQPGSYQIWIVNEGNIASNKKTLTVTSATPSITALNPPSAASASTSISLSVLGSGFDVTSTVLFDNVAQATSYVDGAHLVAMVDCTGAGSCQAGSHPVTVRNGTGGGALVSNPVTFAIGSASVQIASESPPSAYLGQQPTISFTAAGTFPALTQIQVSQPGAAFVGIGTPLAAASGTISAVLDLTKPGLADGAWAVRLNYGGGIYSAFYPLHVLSNGAMLSSADFNSGAQGTTATVTITGANFFPGITVHFQGPNNLDVAIPTTIVSSTAPQSIRATGISLSSLDTGQYQLVAMNTGAPASNPLPFTVTPGLPAIASLTPTTVKQGTQPVQITLTGSNFAKPDANGLNGSVVHASSAALGITDFVIPTSATTVVRYDTIQVSFDTQSAVPGTYNVFVVNPGGTPPPQKSNSDKTLTLTP